MCIIYPREDVRNQSEEELPPITDRSIKVFGNNIIIFCHLQDIKSTLCNQLQGEEEISHNALRKQPEL